MDLEQEETDNLKPEEETGAILKPWVASHWEKVVRSERQATLCQVGPHSS